MIEGIQGRADRDENGVVSYYELFEYIRSGVNNEARDHRRSQTPAEAVVQGRPGWVFVTDRDILGGQ